MSTQFKLSLLLVLLALNSLAAAAPKPFVFPRATPESQGVPSAALLETIAALDQMDAMHSFMMVRHGRVIAEGWWTPYRAEESHELYSLSKSFTSTAVGFAVAEGRLSLDDEVLKFFPNEAPSNPGANLRAMRVRDLLTMNTGNQDEIPTAPDKISVRSFLTNAVPHKPGTHFKYNTPATFMGAAIVEKLTGQPLVEYLQPRLFTPLGITEPVWNTNAQGIALGGYGLNVRTEDIARFGQLYLQKGRWEGRQLLPQSWVEMATSKQVSNGSNPKSDWEQGYGFQFWRCRHGAYRGDGAFGQYCLVLPEQDAVIAITSGLKDMQSVLNVLWDKLLPSLQPKRLQANGEAQRLLTEKLTHLSVRPAEGSASSATLSRIGGRKFLLPPNEAGLKALTLAKREGGGVTVTLATDGANRTFSAGAGQWVRGSGTFGSYVEQPAAASMGWVSEDTLVIKQCFTTTPYYVTHRLRFDGDRVVYDAEQNVSFRNPKQPQLVGHLE